MTGYDFQVTGKEVVEYICTICFLLMKKTLLLPCSHTACDECLSKWEKENPRGERCPTCDESYDKVKVREGRQGKFIDRVVTTTIEVKCKQHHLECDWTGTICDYDIHENYCLYLQLPCVNEGCKEMFCRKDKQLHQDFCEYQIIVCQYCNATIVKKDRQDHYSHACQEFVLPCLNNGCNFEMKRRELNHHIKEVCPRSTITCPYQDVGCKAQMLRSDIQNHCEEFSLFHTSLLLENNKLLNNQLLNLRTELQQQKQQHFDQLQETEQRFSMLLHSQEQQFSQQLQEQQQFSQQLKQRYEEAQEFRNRIFQLEKKTRNKDTDEWTFEELKDLLKNDEWKKFNELLEAEPHLLNKRGTLVFEYLKLKNSSLLHCASYYNRINYLMILIERGANVNVKEHNFNVQPIHIACANGHVDVVTKLLEVDANVVNANDTYGKKPIHYACKNGNVDVLKKILEVDPNMINISDNFNDSPLHIACKRSNLNLAKYLCEQLTLGVNLKDRNGKRADECTDNPEIKKMIESLRKKR